MTILKPALFAATCLLAGCGGRADLYSVQPLEATEKVSIAFNSIEVRDVSLPAYAAADEIAIEATGGIVLSNSDVRWADTPERAVALELTRHLVQISGERIASEPWPFEDYPDAALEVRFESFVARTDGTFFASGQYFVSSEDEGNDDFGLFNLTVPYNPEGGPAAIAAARGQLVLDLANLIAREGLR